MDQQAFGQDRPVIARRVSPDGRSVEVPPGQEALVVRQGRPERTLPDGRHRVQRLFQAKPELYIYPTGSLPLFIWITDLNTADGRAVNLGWRLRVRICDVTRLWQVWMQHQEADEVPLPQDQINARLADPVQELVQQYSLSDLRVDRDVRRQVAGQLSLLIKRQLDAFGLEIAEQFDPEQMRFVTDEEIVAAERERDALRRMREDVQLRRLLDGIENAEALEYRLREWLAERNLTISDATLFQIVQLALRGEVDPIAEILRVQGDLPRHQGTSYPVDLAPLGAHPLRSGLRVLGQIVLIASLVAAAVVAAVAIFEPGLLATPQQHLQAAALVVGIALGGMLIAWAVDRVVHWRAHRAVLRMLTEAGMEKAELQMSPVELRHILMLLGAMAAIGAAGVAMWVPHLYPWFRLGGALIALLGAAIAVWMDWLRTEEQAHEAYQRIHRHVASHRLSAAQRGRYLQRLRSTIAAECQVVDRRLDQACREIYEVMRNREIYRGVDGLRKRIAGRLSPMVARIMPPNGAVDAEEWEQVEAQAQRLQEQMNECSRLAQEVLTAARSGDSEGTAVLVEALQRVVDDLEASLARWSAMKDGDFHRL
ncbi:MAG: hypothetical protein Kow0047_21840 [Anaerolineae bacterium]